MSKIKLKIYIFVVIFVFSFFVGAIQGLAQTSKVSLDIVPSSLKKEYFDKTGKDWDLSSYSERKIFWDNWLIEKKKILREKKIPIKDFEEYGDDYTSVPFDIRYLYERSSGKSWEEATNDERRNYLENYNRRKALLDKANKRYEKKLKREKMEWLRAQLREKMEEEKRLREQQRIEEEKKREKAIRDSEFKQKVEEQKAKLERMRQEMERLHNQ